MNFEYSDEQQQLADSLRKYLGNKYDFEARKAIINSTSGISADAWSTFAQLGLSAIPFAERDGGFGGGAVDLMAAMEAFGEALVVEPLLDTIGLAARLVARLGSAAQRDALLAPVIDGKMQLALAYLEPGARYQMETPATRATAVGGGWTLDGSKAVVVGASSAAYLIVSASSAAAGVSLFIVARDAPGVTLQGYRTVDGQRAADVSFSGVKLDAQALLGTQGHSLPALEEAIDFAIALQCAEAVGALKSASDATLEYLKTRRQFGVPIGSFQVLQHRIVDMYIECEQARSMAILAAAKVDAASTAAAGSSEAASAVTERKRAVSAAKIRIADAARKVSQESVQLHGGMGMTEEMKVSHTFRRLTTIAQRFGDADHHLERYAAIAR
jgi:alkylation response protein AidB-like acyl-CoA dehydrogenase